MKVKITLVKKTENDDLMQLYEKDMKDPCPYKVGEVYYYLGDKKPEGLCEQAWRSIFPYAFSLYNGSSHLFGEWMKNPRSAMVSCDDGFRPASFYLEVVD